MKNDEVPAQSGWAVSAVGYRAFNRLAFVALLLALLFLRAADLDEATQAVSLWGRPMPAACPIRGPTGTPCLGCGMTRALVLFLDGRSGEARRAHAGVFWVAGWLYLQLVARFALGLVVVRCRWLPRGDVAVSLASLLLCIAGPLVFRACVG